MGTCLARLKPQWRSAALALLTACAHTKMQWPVSELRELPAGDSPCDAVVVTEDEQRANEIAREIYGLRWPVYASAITSHFGIRNDPLHGNARFHKGIDVQAAAGTLAYAAANGTVVSEGWAGGHGYQVILDHGGGVRSSYSHLSLALVKRGQRITEGTPLGVVGSTGRSTGPHLHFEVSINDEPMDPLPLLGRLPMPEELSAPAPPRFVFSPVATR